MTDQLANTATPSLDANASVVASTLDNLPDDDAALGALWDQIERDNGAARGGDGKFTKEAGADAGDTDPPLEGEGTGETVTAAESSPATDGKSPPAAVSLPANWNGMEADWAKIPADVQAKIAARDAEIHTRMSEQGRQISAFKPYTELFDRNKDLLAGKKMQDGSDPNMQQAVGFLFDAQRRLDQNPIAGLIEIAERYGVRQHLAAALAGKIQIPSDPASAGVSPADIERIVKDALTADAASKAANDEVSRLSKDKPFYSEIAENDMVHAIHKARVKLGDAASKQAVFDLAYDMAVNADPDLRAKAAAAKAAAVKPDAKRAQDAKRATSVNVTSTTSGPTRQLTDDELLGQAYDEASSKG